MTEHLIEESVSTAPTEIVPSTAVESSVATAVSGQTLALLDSRRRGTGPFMAALVLSAALTAGGYVGIVPLVADTRKRRDEISAESGTAISRYDRELFVQIKEL